MRSAQPANPSYWIDTTSDTEYAALTQDTKADVVVIGGGITGLSTAYLLTQEGARVLLLESNHICSATSGFTTAKVSAQHGAIYSQIRKDHGLERAGLYAESQMQAIKLMRSIVEAEGIDCDLKSMRSCIFTQDEKSVGEIEDEFEVASELGLPVSLETPTDLPFAVASALYMDDQAYFHPRRYCIALADAIARAGGTIVEHTRAIGVQENGDSGCTVQIEAGDITARAAVVATQTPFMFKGLFFARTEASTSYVLAAPYERLPNAMYVSLEQPTRSIRPHSGKDGDVLLLGGGGHPTGRKDDTEQPYADLESWARENFDGFEPEWRWSAEDFKAADGVPYIGAIGNRSPHILVATGFGKWGMTNGTVAARLIADEIAGRDNPWREVFDPTRLKPVQAGGTMLKQVAETVKSIVGDRVISLDAREPEDLLPGQGAVLMTEGQQIAAYRDEEGLLHAVSATCTHMGCIVDFNKAERTWDCPCHGSRFDINGEVLNGPATEDLEPAELGSEEMSE